MTYKAKAPSKTSDQLGFRPKRFWQAVTLFEALDGFEIHLDGRQVKTPKGQILTLPTRTLAEYVMAEWGAVDGHVHYEDMPMTRLGFAALDRMKEVRDGMVSEVLRYAETDLLCYPSPYPQALVERESESWLPILNWAHDELGLIFEQNKTLIHSPQAPGTLNKIQSLIYEASCYEQAGLMAAIPLLGSVVLALALWHGRVTGKEAFSASRIGEAFQSETWGKDEEALQRRDFMENDVVHIEIWFRALL
jgi:chaperone required for assembly of F1-ATPase